MINSSDFAIRLQKVIDFYGETASSFSEKIGVQRSSISHILSGRNKPSLDFVLKVLSEYSEVELYWLLNGKGTFPNTQANEDTASNTMDITPSVVPQKTPIRPSTDEKQIERIVVFYTDGTFKNFEQS